MEHKLILTADDYGLCASVNRAIEACARSGNVRSTNVMTNMPMACEASMLKEMLPGLSVGLHYNFTVGRPLCAAEKVPSLVDADGKFLPYTTIRERCKAGKYSFQELEMEMAAQYARYREICGAPDYWNTHENVHVYPGLFCLFWRTSLGFGIKKMRTHRRLYVPSSSGKSDKDLLWTVTNPIKQRMLSAWQQNARRHGVAAPGGLLVRMNEEDKLRLPYLFSHIRWGGVRVAEMAIHPALDGNCADFGEITQQRVEEYRVFSSDEPTLWAEKCGISLAGFEEVQ